MNQNLVPIKEIFTSIDGEINSCGQGTITTFIRVGGCSCKCQWCDTPSSQEVKEEDYRTYDSVIKEALSHPTMKVTITGGEPLLYPNFLEHLLPLLFLNGRAVTIETNGTRAILPELKCGWVVDHKPPSAKSKVSSLGTNAPLLKWGRDCIKIPIFDEEDLLWAVKETKFLAGETFAGIAWSPILSGTVSPKTLVQTLVQEGLSFVKINCQIHKFLNLQ